MSYVKWQQGLKYRVVQSWLETGGNIFLRRVSSDFTTPCMMFSYPNHSAQYGIPRSLQRLVIRFGGLIKMTDGMPLIYVFGPQLDGGFLHFAFQDCHEP